MQIGKRMRKVTAVLLCAVLTAVLAGCDIFPAESDRLLAAPRLTGELEPIERALSRSIKGEYTLRYPTGGDRRSAVILYDINKDDVQEAFAFYSIGEEEMHLNMIRRSEGKWKSYDDYSISAGGVERIDFYDITGDGVEEVFVGWEIHGSNEKQLAVYSVAGGFTQLMLERYTAYTCCDLDSDGKSEIFLQLLNTVDSTNQAALYTMQNGILEKTSSCAMDRSAKSIVAQIPAPLSSGINAIYVDELKNAGAVTEVLFLSKGQLVNPLLDETKGENARTERAAYLLCADINRDELLEIPVAQEIPAVAGSQERCYYTKWSSFNGEALVTRRTDLINQTDGFYFTFPEKWVEQISVFRDSDRNLREFYGLNGEGMLARLRVMKAKEWDNGGKSTGEMQELCRNGEKVVVGSVTANGDALAISMEELKKQIFIFE